MTGTDELPPTILQTRADTRLQRLFTPLNIAAYVTWLAVVSAVIDTGKLRAGLATEWLGVIALLAMLALFVRCATRAPQSDPRWMPAFAMVQGALVVFAEGMLHGGQTAVLLIIVASQLVLLLSIRTTIAYLFAVNAAIAWLWIEHSGQIGATLQWLVPVIGFQAFAALTGHFAGNSERARAHLAEVNAELLSTRRLLEESARAGERLKLSRELHDVAGHSLTALKLNLARLARDPALGEREELRVATALADDLLHQIRQVVSALRTHDGLDLRAALEALVRPIPGVRIHLDLDDSLRVDSIEQAEVMLRCVQEALTNALRHGRATEIDIRLHRDASGIAIMVGNNGSAPRDIVFGNGLTGMRERLDAMGGTLEVQPTPPRGLRVFVRIPLQTSGGFTA